jgi:anti-anti-sigma regulatory factor
MNSHRIDLALGHGVLPVITVGLGHTVEAIDAALLRDDVLLRIERLAGRPVGVIIDLRTAEVVDAEAVGILQELSQRARRYAHLVGVVHVQRLTPLLEEVQQATQVAGAPAAAWFTTHAEAMGYLTGDDQLVERSVA